MPNREALFDVFSYARPGPGRRDRLSSAEVEQIARTVRRTPEVMVKVLPRGAQTGGAARKHLDYIGRKGELELETDDRERLQGRDAGERLVEDWDLDLESDRRGVGLASTRQGSAKLVHKIMLSMPPGTPAKGVLDAARNFAREEFALKHRYALVLHTDEPHPHVHLVVKAVSEQGVRLNIKKATLRTWRQEFARHLRQQGIAANATGRAVRGETRVHKADGIYRASLRGDSSHARRRVEAVANELLTGGLREEPGKSVLTETRRAVERGWRATINVLQAQGRTDLAAEVRRLVEQMRPPKTEKEQLADALLQAGRKARNLDQAPPTR
jgi:Relaxase/Mobilisation nuclease domain